MKLFPSSIKSTYTITRVLSDYQTFVLAIKKKFNEFLNFPSYSILRYENFWEGFFHIPRILNIFIWKFKFYCPATFGTSISQNLLHSYKPILDFQFVTDILINTQSFWHEKTEDLFFILHPLPPLSLSKEKRQSFPSSKKKD